MEDLSFLEKNWIENLYKWLDIGFSAIGFVVTKDPVRVKQLLYESAKNGSYGTVLYFDPIFGTRRYVNGRLLNFDIARADTEMSLMPQDPLSVLLDTTNTLRDTVIIIDNLDEKRVKGLSTWISSVLKDPEENVYSRNVRVIIIVPSVSYIPTEIVDQVYTVVAPLPTREEKEIIIKRLMEGIAANLRRQNKSNLAIKALELLEMKEMLLDSLSGLTLGHLESIMQLVIYDYIKLNKDPTKTILEARRKLMESIEAIIFKIPDHLLEHVGGYQPLKEYLKWRFINLLKNPEKARKMGLRLPRGLLLFGPPGTGKTWLAEALAGELSIPFIAFAPEQVRSKWYGETETRMRQIIEIIEQNSPAVVFIDEIDTIIPTREGNLGLHEVTQAMLGIILRWLGDPQRKAIIIAATNRPDRLDPALIRAGRFDRIVPMNFPDTQARLEILRIHTSIYRKVPLSDDVNLEEIAERTEFFTGAELEELIMRAIENALRKDKEIVSQEDFLEALETFAIPITQRKQQIQKYREFTRLFTNDLRLLTREEKEEGSRFNKLAEKL